MAVKKVGRWLWAGLLLLAVGCSEDPASIGTLDMIWGRRGISDGRFQKPRAMAIDGDQEIYVVDMTARIQVFDTDGTFLRSWQTPVHDNGRPTGLSIDNAGRLLVADTHYFRVLIYAPSGELLKQFGGTNGPEPGEFGFVTDVVQDSQGNYYVGEYGEWDRIQKFTAEGEFILEWGGHGSQPGQFIRPQNLLFDEENRLWVADACNHRIQVFDTSGKLLFGFGEQGSELGKLSYPYDLVFDENGNLLICEYGNHRVQRFTRDGKSLGSWGKQGRDDGELFNPWALIVDGQGRVHVLDTNNHRVQRVWM